MDTASILLLVKDKLPKNPLILEQFMERLDKLDDKSREEFVRKLSMTKLKSPKLTLIVGHFLFGLLGVSRFMVGNYVLGIVRIILTVIMYGADIAAEVGAHGDLDVPVTGASALFLLTAVVSSVWWIVDFWLIHKRVVCINMERVLNLFR